MLKRPCQDQPKQWHNMINPVLFAIEKFLKSDRIQSSPVIVRTLRGPGIILNQLWTKKVNIPEVKTSYEYVTEFHERLKDLLKLAREELQKSQKRYNKHYDKKAKPRRLEVGDQVLILLPTESNKLLMQWRGPYIVASRVGANNYRVKVGCKTKMYHVNMLKKYIAREPKVDVVHTSNKDDAAVAVARVIY